MLTQEQPKRIICAWCRCEHALYSDYSSRERMRLHWSPILLEYFHPICVDVILDMEEAAEFIDLTAMRRWIQHKDITRESYDD